jgi:hypothetical protein
MTNSVARETDEAVLESIRRLLTDGPPPTRSNERGSPSVEKLLLTPALRVSEDEDAGAPARPGAQPAAWSLEDQIAELEAAVGAVGDWEPDGSEDAAEETPNHVLFHHRDARSAPAESPPLRLGESARAERLPPTDLYDEDDLADARGFDIGVDERLPDEDALRDLVAEIVRSELQSELGQRVTRNIRKLVRREIRRALAARDFD